MKVRSFQLCVVSVNRVKAKPYRLRSFLKRTWYSKFFVTNLFERKINLISIHSFKMQSAFFTLVFAPANFHCFHIFSSSFFSTVSIWIQIHSALFRVHFKPNGKCLSHFLGQPSWIKSKWETFTQIFSDSYPTHQLMEKDKRK